MLPLQVQVMLMQEVSMVYEGYKSTQSTIRLLEKHYPNFTYKCRQEYIDDELYIGTDLKTLRVFAKKVFYPINLKNLMAQTSGKDWIPAVRDKELNDFLNFIENAEDIQQILLMSEL